MYSERRLGAHLHCLRVHRQGVGVLGADAVQRHEVLQAPLHRCTCHQLRAHMLQDGTDAHGMVVRDLHWRKCRSTAHSCMHVKAEVASNERVGCSMGSVDGGTLSVRA